MNCFELQAKDFSNDSTKDYFRRSEFLHYIKNRLLWSLERLEDHNLEVELVAPPAARELSKSQKFQLQIQRLIAVTDKVTDEAQKITSEEFSFFSYFNPSVNQKTTLLVRKNNESPFVPVKVSAPEDPDLKAAFTLGPKLYRGDRRQPEGFFNTDYIGATNIREQYFKLNVQYENSDNNSGHQQLNSIREKLRQSSNNGGDIRVHTNRAGTVGCLVSTTGNVMSWASIAHSYDEQGNWVATNQSRSPKMMTIPFNLSEENLSYFENKIQDDEQGNGLGRFWRDLANAEKENYNYQYAPATPLNEIY